MALGVKTSEARRIARRLSISTPCPACSRDHGSAVALRAGHPRGRLIVPLILWTRLLRHVEAPLAQRARDVLFDTEATIVKSDSGSRQDSGLSCLGRRPLAGAHKGPST